MFVLQDDGTEKSRDIFVLLFFVHLFGKKKHQMIFVRWFVFLYLGGGGGTRCL